MRKLLLLLLFASAASAVLSVQAFTCNGGLLNVQTSVPFNCVAVILNDDVNADATLNTVTLSSLGGWTSATSYAGSFSGNSVPRGSTTSVTFSNIVPTSPGSSKTFSDILINGGSGNAARLADAPLNVVAIKSATLTPSASTVAYGSEFDVLLSLDLGGQANVTAVLGLSGCSLSSGQASSRNFGIVTDSSQSTSWKVTQGSGSGSTCTASAEVRAIADPVAVTVTKTAQVAGSGTAPTPTPTTTTTQTTTSTTSTVTGAPGGASGVSSGTGGGAGGGTGELIVFYGVPEVLEVTEPGTIRLPITLSSFYTGFINYVNITVKGIPKSWYKPIQLNYLSPVSNASIELELNIPPDATGNRTVEIELVGVGTKTLGVIKAKKKFVLVLPPATRAEAEPEEARVPFEVSTPSMPEPNIVRAAVVAIEEATNFPIVALVLFAFIALLGIHFYVTHLRKGPEASEDSNPLPEKSKKKK